MLFDPKWEVIEDDDIGHSFWQAADLLKRGGWCQHGFTSPLGQHCLMGALLVVRDNEVDDSILNRLGFQTCQAAMRWNDHPLRTMAEVIWLLENASNK